jgi:hypothetical protein
MDDNVGIPGDLCTCIFVPTKQVLAVVVLPKRFEDGCKDCIYPDTRTGILIVDCEETKLSIVLCIAEETNWILEFQKTEAFSIGTRVIAYL